MPPVAKPASDPLTPKKPAYQMPVPPAVVVWRNARGGESNFAIVTKFGRSAISVMIFPPDSRVGVPKDGVRFIDDPMNRNQNQSDSGIWEFTSDSLALRALQSLRDPIPTETK